METQGLTQLLDAVHQGDDSAAERLWQAVFHELREIAAAQLAAEHGPRTLQPTALVNEVYLRMFGKGPNPGSLPNGKGVAAPHFQNRRHFFAAAARAMHQILVDDARTRRRLKRGGNLRRVESNEPHPASEAADPAEVLAVDEALAKLAAEQPELVEIVRLRYFIGMTLDETADALAISRRTVATRWRLAKAWLFEAISGESPRDEERACADD